MEVFHTRIEADKDTFSARADGDALLKTGNSLGLFD